MQEPTPRLRSWVLHGLLLALGVGLVYLALQRVDAHAVLAAMQRLGWVGLALCSLVYSLAWAARAARLWLLATPLRVPLAPSQALSTGLGANALNLVAPARLGDVAAFWRLRKLSDGPRAAALMLTWRLVDLGALMLVALAACAVLLVVLPSAVPLHLLVWIAAAGAAFVGFAVVAAWLTHSLQPRRMLETVARRLLGSRAPLGAAFGAAMAVCWSPRNIALGLGVAAGAWLCDLVVAGIILQATWGGAHPFLVVIVPVLLANAAKLLPTTPGGLGVFEGVMWVLLRASGVPDSPALAAAVATHLFMNLFTVVMGVPGAIAVGRAAIPVRAPS